MVFKDIYTLHNIRLCVVHLSLKVDGKTCLLNKLIELQVWNFKVTESFRIKWKVDNLRISENEIRGNSVL